MNSARETVPSWFASADASICAALDLVRASRGVQADSTAAHASKRALSSRWFRCISLSRLGQGLDDEGRELLFEPPPEVIPGVVRVVHAEDGVVARGTVEPGSEAKRARRGDDR